MNQQSNYRKAAYTPRGNAASSTGAAAGARSGKAGPSHTVAFSIGKDLMKVTGLFSSKSKKGTDYLSGSFSKPEYLEQLRVVAERLISAIDSGEKIRVNVFTNNFKD